MKTTTQKSGQRKPSLARYIALSLLIFAVAVLVAVITRMILVFDPRLAAFSDDQASLITSIIDGAVGALAAGFVLYQLKEEELATRVENEIHSADYYHNFISYWLETDRMFLEHPECRKYFYEDADVTQLDPVSDEYQLVMGFAEYFDDLFRYSKAEMDLQSGSFSAIPVDQMESYAIYMDNMRKKPIFQAFRQKYGAWVNSNEEEEQREKI